MTLYDINKTQYSRLPKMTKKDKERAIDTIRDYLVEELNGYYAMINYDTKYFTIFIWQNDSYDAAKDIFETAQSIGEIKAVEKNKDMLEIWIKQKGKECEMYGFFRYDKGVVIV